MTELMTDLKLNNLEDLLNACLNLEANVTKENKEDWSEISALAMGGLNLRTRIDKVLAMKIDDYGPQENEHFSSVDFHRARGKWLGKRAQLKEIQAILGGENNETHS